MPQAPGDNLGSSAGRPLTASSFEERLRGPLVQALFPNADYQPELHSLRLSVAREMPAATG